LQTKHYSTSSNRRAYSSSGRLEEEQTTLTANINCVNSKKVTN